MAFPQVAQYTESVTRTSPINTTDWSSIPKVLDNPSNSGIMAPMKQIKDLLQAPVLALLVGGPVFFYILFQMKP